MLQMKSSHTAILVALPIFKVFVTTLSACSPAMRYENWDVILFPRDSHIPIQEFKTSCFVTYNEDGQQLSTLTCYIVSLPVSTPFRVSLHSWLPQAQPTAIIKSRQKRHQRVVYSVQVMVDGTRVFHDFYEVSSKWPQEIMYEKRSNVHPLQQSSHHKPLLEFPPFRHNVLMQSTWDASEKSGRIKIVLSEQLVGKTSNPSDMEFGGINEIACFSFQHAPREILEQAGVSWPIRNLLYFPSTTHSHPFLSYTPISYSISDGQELGAKKSPGKLFKSPFDRPVNPEPHARPRTAPMPPVSQSSIRHVGDRGGRTDIWDDILTDSLGDPFRDASMGDSRSTHRTSSNLTTDITMNDISLPSPASSKPQPGWYNVPKTIDHGKRKNLTGATRNRHGREKHSVVTLQEDQSGRIIEVGSPPKGVRSSDHDTQRVDQTRGTSGQQVYHAVSPKMGPMSIPLSTRPSAAAVARSASYLDLLAQARNASTQRSPSKQDSRNPFKRRHESPPPDQWHIYEGKENRNPSEGRVASPYPVGKRIPTPHPFLQDHTWAPSTLKSTAEESSVEMQDPPPRFASLSRIENTSQEHVGRSNSPVHVPTAKGNIKSRKEGLGVGTPASTHHDVRHDQSLLPSLGAPKENTRQLDTQTARNLNAPTRIENIINSDEPKPFVLDHRGRMSSMERVETQLFSALGEELNSFNESMAATADIGMASGLDDPDSPLAKRKRQGSLGGDRGKSPNSKLMKDESIETEN